MTDTLKPPHCPICGRYLHKIGETWRCVMAVWDAWHGAWEHT